jgi:hypothetical protein
MSKLIQLSSKLRNILKHSRKSEQISLISETTKSKYFNRILTSLQVMCASGKLCPRLHNYKQLVGYFLAAHCSGTQIKAIMQRIAANRFSFKPANSCK